MLGLMQDWPLPVHKIIDHATLYHGDREVVTRSVEGPIERSTYRQIAVRAKDVIKSGGEWISSIEIENLAVGRPAVAEAAVIAVSHSKWDERPLLVVVPKPGQMASKKDILDYLSGKIAKWWMPDEVVFVENIPHSATGKIQKTALRERFAG